MYEHRIEDVRGKAGGARSESAAAFLERAGEAAAARQLDDVVCVITGEGGEVEGVALATQAEVVPLGGRPFRLYRSLLSAGSRGAAPELFNAAHESLAAGFDPGPVGDAGPREPIGLCVLVTDPAEVEGSDLAHWPRTGLMLAGRLDDGRELRVRYFEGAAIGPSLPSSPSLAETRATDYPLEDRYRIVPFEEGRGEAGHDDVLELWAREGVVPVAEARRRVHEVHLVAIERDEGVVGVSSAYLARNPQLRMDLWHYRAFVSGAHRKSSLAGVLAVRGRELLEQRFTAGDDTRAPGIIYEVENDGLKRHFNLAHWLPTDFWFIGENERGDHVRVHWFEGARAPAGGS